MCEFLFYILIMSKVHCKRVINLVFSVGNTIFANAPGKNHWLQAEKKLKKHLEIRFGRQMTTERKKFIVAVSCSL